MLTLCNECEIHEFSISFFQGQQALLQSSILAAAIRLFFCQNTKVPCVYGTKMYFSLLWLQLVNTAVFHKALKILQPLKLGSRRRRRSQGNAFFFTKRPTAYFLLRPQSYTKISLLLTSKQSKPSKVKTEMYFNGFRYFFCPLNP